VQAASVFTWTTLNAQTDFQVLPGATGAVEVALVETFDSATKTSILDDGGGLFSAGVAVERVGTAPSDPASIENVANIDPADIFEESPSGTNFITTSLTALGGGILVESVDFLVPAAPPTIGDPDTRSIALGTFTFTAGAVFQEQTMFRIHDNDPVTDDTVTADLFGFGALDDVIGTFDFSITVVPLPAAVWPAAALLGAAALRRVARLRRAR